MFYIYIAILVISAIFNLISLGILETGTLNSLISCIYSNEGISESNFILKIDQSKINLDLATDSKNIESKLDSVKVDTSSSNTTSKKIEYKVKNLNPLRDIHQYLVHGDKSHLPSHIQKNCLPKIPEETPVYGNKLVINKPSSLLKTRNLPQMFIEIPKSTNIGKLTELHKAIDGADEAIKLYDTQAIKFSKILANIKNGTEEFYPNEAKPLMETYVDLVAKLSNQQKGMANEAINQLKKLDPNFSRNLYPVDSPKATGTGTLSERVSEIRKRS